MEGQGEEGPGREGERGMEGRGGRDRYRFFVLLIVRFVPDDHFSWNIEN